MMVERRTEAVQKGDAAEPRAGSTRRVGSSGDTGGRDQSPLDLMPTYVAVGSLIAGTIAWPRCRFRIPWGLNAAAVMLGIGLVAAYFVVASRIGE